MFMPSKGGMKEGPVEGVEVSKELEPKRLATADDLEKYWSQIKDLSANALDTGEGRSFSERKDEVKEHNLYSEYLKQGAQGELYVLLKGEKVVAFLAIKKAVRDKEAEIEQLRLVQGSVQSTYIGEIMDFVKKKLEEEGYHHGVVTPEEANERFSRYANRVSRFLSIEENKRAVGENGQ